MSKINTDVTKMVHVRMIDGQYVRKRNSTLAEATQEVATMHGGKVLFLCPNYGVATTANPPNTIEESSEELIQPVEENLS